MAISLSGVLSDVTGHAIDEVSSVTIKASSPTPGVGGVVLTAPRRVDFTPDGAFSVDVEAGVKSWLFIEGPGWSDSVPLLAADGMLYIWQAVINALPAPLSLDELATLKLALEAAARADAAADRAESAMKETVAQVEGDFATVPYVDGKVWAKGFFPGDKTLANVENGLWGVPSGTEATRLGLPIAGDGTLESFRFGNLTFQKFTHMYSGKTPMVWETRYATGVAPTWSLVNDLASVKWYRGALDPGDGGTLATAPEGISSVWSGVNATSLGLPVASDGVLETVRFGNLTYQTFRTSGRGGVVEVWETRYATGVSPVWTRVSDEKTVTFAPSSHNGLKVVPLPLTLGDGNSGGMAASGSFRVPMNFAPKITRWRVCFANVAQRFNKVHKCGATITDLTFGSHLGNGQFDGPARRLKRDLQVPDDGSFVASPWQNIGLALGDDADCLLAFTYTSTGPDTPPGNIGGGWNAGSATATEQTPSTARVDNLPFDIWIEAETYAGTPVFAVVGDSITCGANASLPVYDAWGTQLARKNKALCTLYGTSGDTGASWVSDENAYKVARFIRPDLSRPDAVIWAMGRNDFTGGTTSAAMQEITTKAIDIFARKFTANIFGATITPKNDGVGDAERTAYNWHIKSSMSPFKDVFDFAAVVDDGTGKIKTAYNADGLHFNTAGYSALADAVTRPITTPPIQYQTV